jgi:hypothetical protein
VGRQPAQRGRWYGKWRAIRLLEVDYSAARVWLAGQGWDCMIIGMEGPTFDVLGFLAEAGRPASVAMVSGRGRPALAMMWFLLEDDRLWFHTAEPPGLPAPFLRAARLYGRNADAPAVPGLTCLTDLRTSRRWRRSLLAASATPHRLPGRPRSR